MSYRHTHHLQTHACRVLRVMYSLSLIYACHLLRVIYGCLSSIDTCIDTCIATDQEARHIHTRERHMRETQERETQERDIHKKKTHTTRAHEAGIHGDRWREGGRGGGGGVSNWYDSVRWKETITMLTGVA